MTRPQITLQGLDEASKREAAGVGCLVLNGKAITYTEGGRSCRFWYPRPSTAAMSLRVARKMAVSR
jgi:hypothetical protein